MESVYRLCTQYKGRRRPPMWQNDPRWIACHMHFCSNSGQRRSKIAWGPFDCLFAELARETFEDVRPSSCIDHRLYFDKGETKLKPRHSTKLTLTYYVFHHREWRHLLVCRLNRSQALHSSSNCLPVLRRTLHSKSLLPWLHCSRAGHMRHTSDSCKCPHLDYGSGPSSSYFSLNLFIIVIFINFAQKSKRVQFAAEQCSWTKMTKIWWEASMTHNSSRTPQCLLLRWMVPMFKVISKIINSQISSNLRRATITRWTFSNFAKSTNREETLEFTMQCAVLWPISRGPKTLWRSLIASYLTIWQVLHFATVQTRMEKVAPGLRVKKQI